MKSKFLIINSVFLTKAGVESEYVYEYEGYFKGRKIDTYLCKNKTLDQVKKNILRKNEEFKVLEEKIEQRTVNENGENKIINVKIIKFEILEKSSVRFIENELFKDNLSKYLKENIKFNISYNSIIKILKDYVDENNNEKPIEFGKETNGIIKFDLYQDETPITIDDTTNKDIPLNFTRIHFVFTQDLYKKCPVKIKMKYQDSNDNEYRGHSKKKCNNNICVQNNLSLKQLFNCISIGNYEEYNDVKKKFKKNYLKDERMEYVFHQYIDSEYNINAIKAFNYIKKIIFVDKDKKHEEVIYDSNTCPDVLEILKNNNFKYSYSGEYIIETDLSYKKICYIHVDLICSKEKDDLISSFGFYLNKTFNVKQFKEFLVNSKIIDNVNSDSINIFKDKEKLSDDADIESENYMDRYYKCEIKIEDLNKFKNIKPFGDNDFYTNENNTFYNNYTFDDFFKFDKNYSIKNCCRSSRKK